MNYPEEVIYEEIIDRLKSSTLFADNDHEPPAHYDWDRRQYEPQGEIKEMPWMRPAIFIRFGKITFQQHGSRTKRGTLPLTIIVCQDKYVDSADGAESQDEYKKLLRYKYLVNDLIDGWKGSCFSEVYLTGIETDYLNRNLLVETIEYECKFNLQTKNIA